MIKQNTLKPIEVGYGESKVIFYLRMISLAEQSVVEQRFNDIADSDTEKWQKQFEITRSALGEFSSEMPQRLEKEKGEFVKKVLIEEAETPTVALDKFFAERTVENERVLNDAYLLFRNQLSPSARFL